MPPLTSPLPETTTLPLHPRSSQVNRGSPAARRPGRRVSGADDATAAASLLVRGQWCPGYFPSPGLQGEGAVPPPPLPPLLNLLILPSIACPDNHNPPCFDSDQVGGRPWGLFRPPLNLEGDPSPWRIAEGSLFPLLMPLYQFTSMIQSNRTSHIAQKRCFYCY
jgi:hypothetical protein